MSNLADRLKGKTLRAQDAAFLKWQASWLKTARPQQRIDFDFTECGIMAGRGFGKGLSLDTPIPTPTGWTAMGDLRDGDEVFDESGRICRVVKAHDPYTPTDMYRITFADGTSLDADGDHLWYTLTHADRKQMTRHGISHMPAEWPSFKMPMWDCHGNVTGHRGAQVRDTRSIADTVTYGPRGNRNHCIPVAGALQTPEAKLPIDPWLLGYWLGNGASRDGVIYAGSYQGCFDDDYVVSRIPGAGAHRLADKGHSSISVPGLTNALRMIGVLNNKHVPLAYMRASIEQRLDLLRGLCDSDGYADHKTVEFCSTNQALADAVFELAASLGERPVLHEDRARLNGEDCGPRYRVTWRGAKYNPFGLPRKRDRLDPLTAQAFRHDHRMIVSVEPIPCATVRCITVDSEHATYLAGRPMIPTHNTRVGAEWLARSVYMDTSGYDSCVIAPTYQDVKFTCFEGESGLMSVIPPELIHNYNKSDMVIEMYNISGGTSAIRGFTAEKPERLRGPQHTRAWCTPGETLVRMADGTDRRVDEVQVGEFVMTREGPRRVLMAGRSDNPNAQVRITYGVSRLTATEDHPIFTNRGWVPAGEVREGDLLCAIGASNGAVSVGTLTTVGTTSELTSLFAPSARSGCTGPYGNITTGLYPQGTTFTTPITTSTTTTQPTFISWLEGYIAATITSVVKPLKGSALRLQASCSAFGHVLSIATRRVPSADRLSVPALFLASPGAFAAPSALSVGGWEHRGRPNGPVTCAGRVTLRSGEPVGSVPPPAERSIGSRTRQAAILALASIASSLSSRSGPACASAQKPALTKLAVEGVEKLSTRVPVYCLKVEGEPEYFANGILVHNCDELAAWQYDETWDMMMMGLRLGDKPQVLWTTTPKPKEIVRKLVAPKEGRVIVTGSTYDNKANLPKSFFAQLEQYEGTRLGRQELHGEMIDPEESGIIQRSWFRLWPAKNPLPRFDWIIMSLDTAYTEKTVDKKGDPDPTACSVWGVFHHEKRSNIMLLDCWEDYLGLPELMRRVKRELNTAYGDDEDVALIKPMFGSSKPLTSGRKPDILLIEDKGSGISLRQMLAESNIEAYAYNPGRADKLSRLHIVSPVFAQKRVWLPESDKYPGRPRTWADPLVTQLCSFTGEGSIKHDDFVDSTTQAVRLCLDKGLVSTLAERKVDIPPRKEYSNPYAQ